MAIAQVDDDDWNNAMEAQLSEDEDEEWVDPFHPLYRAVIGPPGTVGEHGDNTAAVLAFLNAGVDVNVRTEQGWTALMATASTGQPVLMHLLLRRGADPAARDKKGNSARDWGLHTVKGHDDDVVLTIEPPVGCAQCIALLELAARPWHPANHTTFPEDEQRLACDLLWMGHALAKQPAWRDAAPDEQLGRAFCDAWEAYVIPAVVLRPRCRDKANEAMVAGADFDLAKEAEAPAVISLLQQDGA